MWQINEETYRQTLESEGGTAKAKTGPEIYYGSIHDILSYPCEVSCFAPCVLVSDVMSTVRMVNTNSYKLLQSPFINLTDSTSRIFIFKHIRLMITSGIFSINKNIARFLSRLVNSSTTLAAPVMMS